MFRRFLELLFPSDTASGKSSATPERISAMRHAPVRLDASFLRSKGIRALDRVVACGTYSDSMEMRSAIHSLKYRSMTVYGESLGRLLAASAPLLNAKSEDIVITPVPLHWTRYLGRSFNQSHVLAVEASKHLAWPVRTLLRRMHATGHQVQRSRSDRKAAMRDVFRVIDVVPAHVVLVDDVLTTGATLDACARALKEAGVERVDALTVLHGL